MSEYESPPSFRNRNGTFEIGEWVSFAVDREDWAGPTGGDIRHNGNIFYVRTPAGNLPICPGFVIEDSIRRS